MILPAEPHLPGLTPRPDEALFAPLKQGLAAGLPPEVLAESAAFAGGRTAFARRYYWEAHELFEAVWTCLPPAGAERHLLRGLIQLANAGLKGRMGRTAAARRILALADAALSEAFLRSPPFLMGLSPAEVEAMRSQVETESAL